MRYKNELIVGIVIVLTLMSLASNFYVLNEVQKEEVRLTGKATSAEGRAQMCINTAPEIDISGCSSFFIVNYTEGVRRSGSYNCTVMFSDVETAYANLTVWSNTSFFNLTLLGRILFTPDRSTLGILVAPLFAEDEEGCANSISTKNLTVDISYANLAPLLTRDYPDSSRNLNLRQYYTTYSYSLDNFFYDPNGDHLYYDYVYLDSFCYFINIQIDEELGTVRYSPGNFNTKETGPCRAYFTARDDYGGRNRTQLFNITVLETILEEPKIDPPSSGGGGGGGARPEKLCVMENVTCTNWTPCMYNPPPWNLSYEGPEDGIMTRECQWYTNCPGEMKPGLSQVCDYIPTCSDGILNQGEEKIDCGGPCPACATCSDGVMNCHVLEDGSLLCEEWIDCGGPCPACATCSDGVMNCHVLEDGSLLCEEGVDCGGPCPACVEVQYPALISSLNWTFWLLVLSALILSGLTIYRYRDSVIIGGALDKISNPRILVRDVAAPFKRALNTYVFRKREDTKKAIESVLGDLNKLISIQGDLYPVLMKSGLFKAGLDAISKKRAVMMTLLPAGNAAYAFGTNPTVSLTVSAPDVVILREVLARLHSIDPIYQAGAKVSAYGFKPDMSRRMGLEYEERAGVLIGLDKQVTLSIIPRSAREEKSIISTIKEVIQDAPKEKLVWRYNNVHVFRPGSSDKGLSFNMLEKEEMVLLVPSQKRMKGFKQFRVEVESW